MRFVVYCKDVKFIPILHSFGGVKRYLVNVFHGI
jgi:hypothetical protein